MNFLPFITWVFSFFRRSSRTEFSPLLLALNSGAQLSVEQEDWSERSANQSAPPSPRREIQIELKIKTTRRGDKKSTWVDEYCPTKTRNECLEISLLTDKLMLLYPFVFVTSQRIFYPFPIFVTKFVNNPKKRHKSNLDFELLCFIYSKNINLLS